MNEMAQEIPLTAEQRQLAADNHGLIYSYASRHSLSVDEYYDILAIGLCYATKSYDPSRGFAFSTYAYSVMGNEVIRYWRHKGRAREIPEELMTSIQERVRITHGGDREIGEGDREIGEMILYDETIQNPDTSRIEVAEFLNSLNDQQRKIALYLCSGLTHNEIGKILGISGSYVGMIKNGIIERYYAYIGRYDLACAMRTSGRLIRNGKWGKK